MSDTMVQDCKCCQVETDCIDGLCEMCSDYNYKLQKQVDLLILGLLQEKREVATIKDRLNNMKYATNSKEFRSGYNAGLTAYAWWKEGVQYVGTCGTTLKKALNLKGDS